jgi:hypothetical protein
MSNLYRKVILKKKIDIYIPNTVRKSKKNILI